MGGWGVRIPPPTYLTDGAGPPTAARLLQSRTVSMVPLYVISGLSDIPHRESRTMYARCACHMIAAFAAFAAVDALVEAPCAAAQVRLREWNASYNGISIEIELLRFMSCDILPSSAEPTKRPLAYDLGMNHGQTAVLYLAQGYRVVAVEANPALAALFRSKVEAAARSVAPSAPEFAALMARFDKRLLVLNNAVTAANSTETHSSFCVDPAKDVRSHVLQRKGAEHSLCAPDHVISVPATSCDALLRSHGRPELLKCDIEGQEMACLRALATLPPRLLPEVISFESPLWTCATDACAADLIDTVSVLDALGYDKWKRQWWGVQAGHGVAAEDVLDCGRINAWRSADVVRHSGCGQTTLPLGHMHNGSKHPYGSCDFLAKQSRVGAHATWQDSA